MYERKLYLEEYFQLIDNKAIHEIPTDFVSKHRLLIESELLAEEPETMDVLVTPSDEFKLIKQPEDSRDEFHYWKKLDVKWLYRTGNEIIGEEGHKSFEFWVIGYINVGRGVSSFEIVDPIKYHLKRTQDYRIDILGGKDLKSLFEYKDDYFMESGVVGKIMDVCRNSKQIVPIDGDYHIGNDLANSSNELLTTLSELYMIQPYVRSYIGDPQFIPEWNKTIYRYFPSFYDKRYFHLASVYLQSLYNHWAKVADLLYHFFDTGLKQRQVDFSRVIDKIENYDTNENYLWLKNFKNEGYADMNRERKKVVHCQGLDAAASQKYLEANDNREELERLQLWKEGLPEEFEKWYRDSITGLKKALMLIESVPKEIVEQSDN